MNKHFDTNYSYVTLNRVIHCFPDSDLVIRDIHIEVNCHVIGLEGNTYRTWFSVLGAGFSSLRSELKVIKNVYGKPRIHHIDQQGYDYCTSRVPVGHILKRNEFATERIFNTTIYEVDKTNRFLINIGGDVRSLEEFIKLVISPQYNQIPTIIPIDETNYVIVESTELDWITARLTHSELFE